MQNSVHFDEFFQKYFKIRIWRISRKIQNLFKKTASISGEYVIVSFSHVSNIYLADTEDWEMTVTVSSTNIWPNLVKLLWIHQKIDHQQQIPTQPIRFRLKASGISYIISIPPPLDKNSILQQYPHVYLREYSYNSYCRKIYTLWILVYYISTHLSVFRSQIICVTKSNTYISQINDEWTTVWVNESIKLYAL